MPAATNPTPAPVQLPALPRRTRPAQPQAAPDLPKRTPPSQPQAAPDLPKRTLPAQPPGAPDQTRRNPPLPEAAPDLPKRTAATQQAAPELPKRTPPQQATPDLPKRTAAAQPQTTPELPKRTLPSQPQVTPELPKRTTTPPREAGPGSEALSGRATPPWSRTESAADAPPNMAALTAPPTEAGKVPPAGSTAPPRPEAGRERDTFPAKAAAPAAPPEPAQVAPARPQAPPAEDATPSRDTAERTDRAPAGTRRATAATAPPARPARLQRSGRQVARRRRSHTARLLVPIIVVVVVAAATAIALSLRHGPATPDRLSPLPRVDAATVRDAADWVASEVSRTAVVSCDPQMCAALVAAGFPSANVRKLGPTTPYPVTSTLVIITPNVQALFGTSLPTEYAPEVLTTFGTGAGQITIRVIAKHGAAAYLLALRREIAYGKQIGADLVGSSLISTTPAAKSDLLAGLVDQRLLLALTALAGTHPIDIVDFGNYDTGGSINLPLRYVDLAESVPAAHMSQSAYVASMLSVLRSVPAMFRSLQPQTISLDGELVLRIVYSAPSPPNLLGPG